MNPTERAFQSVIRDLKQLERRIERLQTTEVSAPISGEWHPVTQGAVGDGVTDDTDAFNTMVNTTITGSALVPIDRSYYFASSFSIPTNITLDFRGAGKLALGVGATLTVSAHVDASPTQEIFDVSAGGAVQPNHNRHKWYANWWSGGDLGARWNNMVGTGGTHAMSRTALTDATPRHFATAPGNHTLTTSMDLSGFRNVSTFELNGNITASASAGMDVAVDLIDSTGTAVWIERLTGSSASPPQIGVLLSRRESDQRSAAKHEFKHLRIQGAWTIATFYNIASEETRFPPRTLLENDPTVGKYVLVLADSNNYDTVTSAYETPATTRNSATGLECFGLLIDFKDAAAAFQEGVDPGVAAIADYGFSNVVLSEPYIQSPATHILLDNATGSTSLSNVVVYYAKCHGGPPAPSSAVVFKGNANDNFSGIDISLRDVANGVTTMFDASAAECWFIFCQFTTQESGSGRVGATFHANAELHNVKLDLRSHDGTVANTAGDLLDVVLPTSGVFIGEIYMAFPSGNLTAAGTMGGVVYDLHEGTHRVYSYSTLEVVSKSIYLDSNQGLKWGNGTTPAIVGWEGATNDIEFYDEAGTLVCVLRTDQLAFTNGVPRLVPRTAAPATIQDGMLAYSDGTTWNPIGDGNPHIVARVNGLWKQLDN